MKIILPIAAALLLTTAAGAQTPGKEGVAAARTTNGVANWATYNADLKGSRYSPLDQINPGNFKDLEIAWRFKTDILGSRPEYKLESTPLAVDGVIYTTGGTRRAVVALNGATGELLWQYAMHEGKRSAESPRALSGRGLSYWTDGTRRRILYVTIGYRLVSLDADTGRPDPEFGTNGVVDLKTDYDQDLGDLDTGEVGVHSAPAVSGNTIIIGAAFGKVVDAVVSLVMTSLLAPALKAANVSAISAWPAGAVIVALINFLVIALVVFLIVRSIESLKRGERAVAAPDPQAQLAAAATRLAEALDRRQL